MAHFESMVARRAAGEPLQYVLGSWAFRELDLWVDGRVLIPRPETEHVVEHALGAARALLGDRRSVVIADLGTGSGAIALSLAHELPLGRADIWATDVSEDALAVARANLAGVGRVAAAVRLAQGDVVRRAALGAAGRARPDRVEPAVRRLDGCASRRGRPVGARRRALRRARPVSTRSSTSSREAPRWLAPHGVLVVEIGESQGERGRSRSPAPPASPTPRSTKTSPAATASSSPPADPDPPDVPPQRSLVQQATDLTVFATEFVWAPGLADSLDLRCDHVRATHDAFAL